MTARPVAARGSLGQRVEVRWGVGRRVSAHEIDVVSLFDEHSERILEWFYSRTLCWATASDLTSETFLTAVERSHRWDPRKGTAGAWLWGIARNLLRRFHESTGIERRAMSKAMAFSVTVVDDDSDGIAARLDAIDLVQTSVDLDLLSASHREALRLRVMGDRSYDEVAAELGCSPGAARVRVSRALATLYEALGEPDGAGQGVGA